MAAAIILCVAAVTRDPTPPRRSSATEEVRAGVTTGRSPSQAGQAPATPSEDVTTVPTNPPASAEEPPRTADARRVDFALRSDLPAGFRSYDNAAVGAAMGLRDGLLQHGRPAAPYAVSSLETRLGADVRKLGARVRFPDDNSGAVVLVAWRSSLVDSRLAGRPRPASGLRLVVTPGRWALTSVPGDSVLASGSFAQVPGTATVEVYRDGDRAWVVDPSGAVTTVSDPRIAELAGPWACWQLYEPDPAQTPAVIDSIWAG